MRVKIESTGNIVIAKRFKDMTEVEKWASIGYNDELFDGDDIFIPYDNYDEDSVMMFMFDSEVFVIEED